ncbi:citrate (Si)-synthase, partial [Marinomonas arenicola]
MADNKAQLTVDGIDKTIQLAVLSGTLGTDVIDVRSLGSNGIFTYDPAYMSTGSCESAITYIDVEARI